MVGAMLLEHAGKQGSRREGGHEEKESRRAGEQEIIIAWEQDYPVQCLALYNVYTCSFRKLEDKEMQDHRKYC